MEYSYLSQQSLKGSEQRERPIRKQIEIRDLEILTRDCLLTFMGRAVVGNPLAATSHFQLLLELAEIRK